MHVAQQIIFIIVALIAVFLFAKKVRTIRRNILLGKDEPEHDRKDRAGERIKNVILLAFGQKKMFKRPLPAVLHFFCVRWFCAH